MNGLESERDRREEAQKMLNWGFVNFKAHKVFDKDEVVGDVRVWGGQKWTLPVKAKEDVVVLLPVNAKDQRIRAQIAYQGPLKPPLKEGDPVGEVRITSQSGTSNSAPLYAAADLEAGGVIAKGVDSLLLGVNAYVSQAVTKYLKKPPAQPVNTAVPAVTPKS
jgi:D-alanyl-D-alanine carboxypeptidase (penicillin-binding protein 5/6)